MKTFSSAFPYVAWIALIVVMATLGSCDVPSAGSGPWPITKARPASGGQSAAAAAPQAPVLVYQTVEPDQAVRLNAQMPVSTGPIVAARPFKIGAYALDAPSRNAAVDCLTAAIYFEAASEGEAGQKAVAQVVLNRLRHPAFAKTICGVVFAGAERTTGCQFTFTCDGSLGRSPTLEGWKRARRIAERALAGAVDKVVGLSTHYHTRWVVPHWRADLTKLAVVGAHIFYNWNGGWGRPAMFGGRHLGSENLPPQLLARLPSAMLSAPSQEQADANGGSASPSALFGRSDGTAQESPAPSLAERTGLRADQPRVKLAADDTRGTLIID